MPDPFEQMAQSEEFKAELAGFNSAVGSQPAGDPFEQMAQSEEFKAELASFNAQPAGDPFDQMAQSEDFKAELASFNADRMVNEGDASRAPEQGMAFSPITGFVGGGKEDIGEDGSLKPTLRRYGGAVAEEVKLGFVKDVATYPRTSKILDEGFLKSATDDQLLDLYQRGGSLNSQRVEELQVAGVPYVEAIRQAGLEGAKSAQAGFKGMETTLAETFPPDPAYDGKTSGELENLIRGVSRSAPGMAVTGLAGLPMGMGFNYAQITGQKFAQNEAEGADPYRNATASHLSGLAQAPLESLGDLITLGAIKRAARGNNLAEKAIDLVKASGGEAVENVAQGFPEDVADYWTKNPGATLNDAARATGNDPELLSRVWERTWQGAAGGALLAGTGQAVGGVYDASRRMLKKPEATTATPNPAAELLPPETPKDPATTGFWNRVNGTLSSAPERQMTSDELEMESTTNPAVSAFAKTYSDLVSGGHIDLAGKLSITDLGRDGDLSMALKQDGLSPDEKNILLAMAAQNGLSNNVEGKAGRLTYVGAGATFAPIVSTTSSTNLLNSSAPTPAPQPDTASSLRAGDPSRLNATAFPGSSQGNHLSHEQIGAFMTDTPAGQALSSTLAELRAAGHNDLADKVQITSANAGGHVPNSRHYKGQAVDINARALTTEEQAILAGVAQRNGLVHDVAGEPWHFSYRGQNSGGTAAPTISLADRVIQAESNGNPNAQAGTSSARGLGQFTRGTRDAILQQHGVDAWSKDPAEQRRATELLIEENRQSLRQSLGREPNDGEIYMAQFLGASGAKQFLPALTQAPNDVAANHASEAAVKANQTIFYHTDQKGRPILDQPRTVQQVYDLMAAKVGGGQTVSAGAASTARPAPTLPGSIVEKQDANGSYLSLTVEGVGEQRFSHSGNGVYSRFNYEDGKTSHTILNKEGSFVSPSDIRRNNTEAADDSEVAWVGTAEERALATELAAISRDISISDSEASKAQGLLEALVTGKIDVAEARRQMGGSPVAQPNTMAAPVAAPIVAPQPEPQAYIDAQVKAMADPRSSKRAVLVTPGSPLPTNLPQGTQAFLTQHGTVLTSDPQLVRTLPYAATDEQMGAAVLNWEGGRPPTVTGGEVVRALDANGTPVGEVHVLSKDVPKAMEAMRALSPVGKAVKVSLNTALTDRQQTLAQEQQAPQAAQTLVPGVSAPQVAQSIIQDQNVQQPVANEAGSSGEWSGHTVEDVQRAVPTGNVSETDYGQRVDLPNGMVLHVKRTGEIAMTAARAKIAVKGGYEASQIPRGKIVGAFQMVNGEGVIKLTEAGRGSIDEEVMHFARKAALTTEENALLNQEFAAKEGENSNPEERIAHAYQAFVDKRGPDKTGLFAKIMRFFEGIRQHLFPTAQGVFRQVADGTIWERAVADEIKSKDGVLSGPGFIQYGLRHFDKWLSSRSNLEKETALKRDFEKWATSMGYTSKQAKQVLDSIKDFHTVMSALPQELFDESTRLSPIRGNADYIKTVDMNTICPKRFLYAATINEIQGKLGRPLGQGELMRVAKLLKAEGKEYPCLYCYVESGRGAYNKAILDYIKNQDTTLDPRIFTDQELEKQARANPDMGARIKKARGYAQAASMSNQPKEYSEYKGQILRMGKALKDRINNRAGLRFFSNTDLQPDHILDLMQVITDMGMADMKGHLYTKVPETVEIFGGTGLKINMSIYATVKDGQLVFDDTQGFPWEKARELRQRFENAGTIMVVSSEEALKIAMAHPEIDMIIPWHLSGQDSGVAAELGMKNFSYYQQERWLDPAAHKGEKAPHFYEDKHGNDKATYLRLCAEAGVQPKFPQHVINKGYMKMIRDYARTDTPQEFVRPVFDVEKATAVLTDWAQAGGRPNAPDAGIVEKFMAGQEQSQEAAEDGVQYSLNTDSPIFFSQMQRVLEKPGMLPKTAPANAMLAAIQKHVGKFKGVELEESGLAEWLGALGNQPVTRQDVLDEVASRQIEIKEVEKGDIPSDWRKWPTEKMRQYLLDSGKSLDDIPENRGDLAYMVREVFESKGSATKYGQYQVPGGENYKELLLTLPAKKIENIGLSDAELEEFNQLEGTVREDRATPEQEDRYNELVDKLSASQNASPPIDNNYSSSHWSEPNVLAHIRTNERTDADGKRVLFIEEIQSDWHQAGREKGYQTSAPELSVERGKISDLPEDKQQFLLGYFKNMTPDSKIWVGRMGGQVVSWSTESEAAARRNVADTSRREGGVPDAPFKSTSSWAMLAMKRMIRHAAANGFDRISWTPGEVQAERYDLSKQLNKIDYEAQIDEDTGEITGYDFSAQDRNGNEVIAEEDIPLSRIEELAGKEIAQKIEAGEGAKTHADGYREWKTLSGLDLKVGGEGMKGFYDQILPKEVARYIKQFGGKVETRDGMWSFDLTDKMRQAAMEGQPQYSFADAAQESRWQEGQKGTGGKPGVLELAKAKVEQIKNGFTRHFINLPKTEHFARAHEWFRQIESAPEFSQEAAIRNLENITKGLTPAEFEVFQRKVVLDDFAHGVSEGITEFPFGLTAADVTRENLKFSNLVMSMPNVGEALRKRREAMDAIGADLVKYGILRAEQLKNPAYFRHEVLKYAKDYNQAVGTGKEIKKPKPGYSKKRTWSTEDISSNYLEVDGAFMMRAGMDIATAKMIEKIKKSDYNIKAQLTAQAKAENEAWLRANGINPAGLKQADIRKAMGDNFKTWRDLIPDTHDVWQADKGLLYRSSTAISDHVAMDALDALSDPDYLNVAPGVLQDVVAGMQKALMVSGRKPEMVLPTEIVKTLQQFKDPKRDTLLQAAAAVPLGKWKQWVLMNPHRVLKYNLNNMSGDADAVIAGNPHALKQLAPAVRELWQVMKGKAAPSQRYTDAVERGVFTSGLSVQEISDIKSLDPFQKLLSDKQGLTGIKPVVMKLWRASKDYTQFRENWLRYAAYLDYVERLESGESLDAIGYGAAHKALVDGLDDPKDKAAVLARSLVGDYGAISHYGQDIRRTIIPFYSWMEVNTARYSRLFRNAFAQSINQGLKTGGIAGLTVGARTAAWLGIRYALVNGLIYAWNHLAFPDEEDELPQEEQAQLHVILGRDEDGKIRTMRLQGALSDFLGWVGYKDVVSLGHDIATGNVKFKDVAKAPVNKIVGGLTPIFKTPLEMLSGSRYFPDVFRPRPIDDRWRELARMFSLENEYDAAVGNPSKGYLSSWTSSIIYNRDPGEMAYGETRSMIRSFKESKGDNASGFSSSPKTEAAKDYKLALRYGDTKAEKVALEKLAELGMDRNKIDTILLHASPLASIPLKEREEFLESLNERDRKQVDKADRWYRDTFLDARQEAKYGLMLVNQERSQILDAYRQAVLDGDKASMDDISTTARKEYNDKVRAGHLPVQLIKGSTLRSIRHTLKHGPSKSARKVDRYLNTFDEEDNDE